VHRTQEASANTVSAIFHLFFPLGTDNPSSHILCEHHTTGIVFQCASIRTRRVRRAVTYVRSLPPPNPHPVAEWAAQLTRSALSHHLRPILRQWEQFAAFLYPVAAVKAASLPLQRIKRSSAGIHACTFILCLNNNRIVSGIDWMQC
jgi:hypothetical protein